MRTFFVPELEKAEHQGIPMLSSISLKGNQDKWYDKDEKLIVKAALFDGFVWWEDWKVEVISSILLSGLGINAVEQWPCRIDDGDGNTIYGSYSKDFREARERYVPFSKLLRAANLEDGYAGLPAANKIAVVNKVLSPHLGTGPAERFVDDMCQADYLLGNVDRHTENFGILIQRDKRNKVIRKRPAPLYDFGMGLFQNQKGSKYDDLELERYNMIKSPFAIDLDGAYAYYRDHWRRKCEDVVVSLTSMDFPSGLGKQYLENALASLGIKLEV